MTLQSVMFCALISVWNHSKRSGHYLELQEKDGGWKSLGSGYVTSWSTAVLVRQVNNRWEYFGYFSQDSDLAIIPNRRFAPSASRGRPASEPNKNLAADARSVSNQTFKPTSSSEQASSAFSNIVQIDIKPVKATKKSRKPHVPTSSPTPNAWEHRSIEAMVSFLRGAPMGLVRPIEGLCCWTEVLDVSGNEAIRPIVGRLCSEFHKAGLTALEVLDHAKSTATVQEKHHVSAKLQEFAKREKKQLVKQMEDEVAHQKKFEVVEQRAEKMLRKENVRRPRQQQLHMLLKTDMILAVILIENGKDGEE